MKQEIKKEVVLQMIWDRHFDLGMEKDLDDICEDIYNEVFVPLLGKARKETATKIFDILYQWLDLEQIEKYGFVTIQKFDFLRKFREIFKQFGIEVE